MGKRNALLKTLAGILGVPFDSLKQRDRIRRRRMQAVGLVIGLTVISTAGFAAFQTWQQQIAEGERRATEMLSIAEANLRRGEYETGREYLKYSLSERREIGKQPSADQLSLVYRSLIKMPGRPVASNFGKSPFDFFNSIANGSLLMPLGYGSRVPLVKTSNFSIQTYLDLSPVSEYLHSLGFSRREIAYKSYNGAGDVDLSTNQIYIAAYDRIYIFDVISGSPKGFIDLTDEPRISRTIERELLNIQEITVFNGGLVVELGEHSEWLAIERKGGGWKLIRGREVAEVDSVNNLLYLESGNSLEVYKGENIIGKYKGGGKQITHVEQRGEVVSLVEEDGDSKSIQVLSADLLEPQWKCAVDAADINGVETITTERLLVLTDGPRTLSIIEREGDGCRYIVSRETESKYFVYNHERNVGVVTRGQRQSDIFELEESGVKYVASLPFRTVSVAPSGRYLAVKDGQLIEAFPKGPFYIEMLNAGPLTATDDLILFARPPSFFKVVSLVSQADKENIVLNPGLSGAYFVFDEHGNIEERFRPKFSDKVIKNIINEATENGLISQAGNSQIVKKMVERSLRGYGLGYHIPIKNHSYKGYVYGQSWGVLSRFKLVEKQVELLPVPPGRHWLNESKDEIWNWRFHRKTLIQESLL